MRSSFHRYVLVLIMLFVMPACNAQILPVKTIYQSDQCGDLAVGNVEIANAQAFTELYSRLMPQRMPSQAMSLPVVDWKKETLIQIAMGVKPNSAYGLNLNADKAHFEQGVLTLPISVSTPEPDRMYAQMMVSPCLLLSIPRIDGIEEIRLGK